MEFITPIFKWIHIIAGVLWIGLLYFFNWINGHVAATMDGDTKKKVVPELMPRALYFFRWGAAWTWVTGMVLLLLVYWMQMNDSMFRELEIGEEASKFKHAAYLIPFIMVFVYDAFYKSSLAKNTRVATITSFMGIAGVLCLLICVSEMTSYRAYNIHLGTMFGSMMAFNVWYRIWPAQQRIITAIKNGDAPNPADAGMAGLRSKHNTYMSVPLIWTMINEHTVGVSHYLNGYGLLLVMVAIGWHIVFQIYKKSAKVQGF
ncbi:MAG: urate hydroxylase PuuD [Candidatus Marinimicrobia bacterium]|nr:urate hydroxylase PuuD [Candidatus Neomarinimicrobiota bacterium]